jgi:hypothetical protein
VSELIYDRHSVDQSVLVSGAHLGPVTNFSFATKFLFRHLRFCKFVAPSLTRGQVCKLLYNCFWALPEQSLLGRSPAELPAFFYCLIRDSTNLEGQVPVFRSHVSTVQNIQFLPLGGLHGKRAVQRGIWVPTQFTLRPRKTTENLDRVGRSQDLPNANDF